MGRCETQLNGRREDFVSVHIPSPHLHIFAQIYSFSKLKAELFFNYQIVFLGNSFYLPQFLRTFYQKDMVLNEPHGVQRQLKVGGSNKNMIFTTEKPFIFIIFKT